MNKGLTLASLMIACCLAGCVKDEDPGCACTEEYRMNVCVTVNGSATVPDSLTFLREREGGQRDSLESFMENHCFGELPGTQRILMLQDSSLIDSSSWFTLDTVDCCHGEATTVDFVK
jgi:hypothetical protein